MISIKDGIIIVTAVGALTLTLWFWWVCVKATCQNLAREWAKGQRESDTQRRSDTGGEDD